LHRYNLARSYGDRAVLVAQLGRVVCSFA
jgi:ABC-type hemin transport system ATPase subunit